MSKNISEKLETFLDGFKAKDLTKDKKDVYAIPMTATVEETLKELNKKNILSMPVIDKKKNKYVGIVSISDIVIATCFNPCFAKFAKGKEAIDSLKREDMAKIVEASVLKSPVSDLVGMTEETKNLWVFDEEEKLGKLAEFFSQGVHRALIKRLKGSPCLVSQTDFVKFIATQIKESKNKDIVEFLKQPLDKLGNVHKGKSVVSVREDETALTGFRRLLQWQSFRDWNLAALPIVDKKGAIIGNLSESDLRGLNENRLLDVLFVVPMYMKTFYGEMRKPETITADCSFMDALDKLIDCKVHRLWIVDNDKKPIGVFSLSDVISQFTTFAWSHLKAMEDIVD
ncbi:hypothetical protein AAMO2058_000047400 [Amorphochlora amoebiformis]|uniref:CBS domain-containing protein n=1 Tax=Amorphochlora amoebiformis TaxID=1561963 RepID=A0A7S0GXY0_9EUKA|mmetsp:Transcript_21556/g.34049  ORF Transcript_21556/g.34049 Transcript_21556/m.34049 type:complete len:341 (+) Transcript_21556:91-1113(+)